MKKKIYIISNIKTTSIITRKQVKQIEMSQQTVVNVPITASNDLSFTRGTMEDREMEKSMFSDGKIIEIYLEDKYIGKAIYNNSSWKTYWCGYVVVENSFNYPFDNEDAITLESFKGCPLQEITFGSGTLVGFDHGHLADEPIDCMTGQSRTNFYATLGVVVKEVVAMYLFLNHSSNNKRKAEEVLENNNKKGSM